MQLKISSQTKAAMVILEIKEYPFTGKEVTDNFRRLIKLYHPDNNGNKEKSRMIIDAYKKLQNLGIENFEKPLENGDFKVTCEFCNGTGFKYKRVKTWITCPVCNADGDWCRRCDKSGKIFTYIGKIEQVQCPKCRGLKYIVINPFNPVIIKDGILI